MEKLYQCASNFYNLLRTKYVFHIATERKLRKIVLDFAIEDFRHVSGLHYVDDINMEKNPRKLVASILEGHLNDEIIKKSSKYKVNRREGGSVKERIEELCYLENYLDKSDFIRIFKMQDFGSAINAEYFIEASDVRRHSTVYIFIRKREENDNYVIVSFFKKIITYKGQTVYWMLKEKYKDGKRTMLYKHPQYKKIN